MIVGGIQEPNKANLLHLLFYRTDNHKPGSKGDTASYEIKVELYPDTTLQKDFEILINQAQVDSNS